MTTITNLADLCEWAGADSPRSLNHRLYKDTACGASLSLLLPSGDLTTCLKCRLYFTRFSCGANVGQGECDCPRCQGFCGCDRLRWVHCGDARWETLPIETDIEGFTIQTIVEGSDAEVNSDTFTLPCDVAYVETWVAEMESQADELWQDANRDDTEATS
jgi:hypothetical protein